MMEFSLRFNLKDCHSFIHSFFRSFVTHWLGIACLSGAFLWYTEGCGIQTHPSFSFKCSWGERLLSQIMTDNVHFRSKRRGMTCDSRYFPEILECTPGYCLNCIQVSFGEDGKCLIVQWDDSVCINRMAQGKEFPGSWSHCLVAQTLGVLRQSM